MTDGIKGTFSPENEGIRDPHRPLWQVLGAGVLGFAGIGAAMLYVAGVLGWAGLAIAAVLEAVVVAALIRASGPRPTGTDAPAENGPPPTD
jgi:hypothetical protein